jgi:hypothetical protein
MPANVLLYIYHLQLQIVLCMQLTRLLLTGADCTKLLAGLLQLSP